MNTCPNMNKTVSAQCIHRLPTNACTQTHVCMHTHTHAHTHSLSLSLPSNTYDPNYTYTNIALTISKKHSLSLKHTLMNVSLSTKGMQQICAMYAEKELRLCQFATNHIVKIKLH